MRGDFTDITVLLDRSGSMANIRDSAIKGFNDFVHDQQSVPGDGCWSLVQFDYQYEVVYTGRRQGEATLLSTETFVPRGSTALIDAACRLIDETGARLAALPDSERPTRVLMVILTDGEENASKHYKSSDLADRITHQREKYNWHFIFLGANQDAIATAASYGIKTAVTYQATAAGTRGVFNAVSGGTRRWKLDGNNTADNLYIDPVPDVNVNVTVKTS